MVQNFEAKKHVWGELSAIQNRRFKDRWNTVLREANIDCVGIEDAGLLIVMIK